VSLDSFCARALTLELRPLLIGSRVQKFSQLSELDFLMHLRSPGRTDKLLFSLHPERSRFHLVPDPHPPAVVPSAFLMLCRKHIAGCRTDGMSQLGWERALEMVFSSGYRLVFDWAGRPSALLLLEPRGTIAGTYPGPSRGRFAPRQSYQVKECAEPQTANLPPLWQRRLAGLDGEALDSALKTVLEPLRSEDPEGLYPGLEADGELSYRASKVIRPYPTMSLAAAERWSESTRAPGLPDHRADLLRSLRKGMEKARRKMEKRQKDKAGAETASRDQLFGDLLLAYASTLVGRPVEFRGKDWEGRPVTIPLEPQLSATENAERYYLRAKKKRRALAVLDEQIAMAGAELAFWEELIFAAESAESRTDLEEVRRAIPGPRQGRSRKGPEAPSSGPRRFEHAGFLMLVGRNPTQNEKLSLRDAAKDDRWFHVQKGAGAHVLLRTGGREPGQETLLAAAWLAATYSRSQGDPRCAVITTLARNLKKPKGGPPGKVVYRSEREIVADPTGSPPQGLQRIDKKGSLP
jgi:predicted ribosome quality control (RQC) complex YloA/Tae2 family protein